MNFTVHEIGNHQFIEVNGYVTAMTRTGSKEVQIKNLQDNYQRIKAQVENKQEAFLHFAHVCGMRKRADWIDYTYDGACTNLLKEHGYAATLPIKHALGEFIQINIRYWKEQEGDILYCIFDQDDCWQGTIRNKNEEPVTFFERFIGEVCFHNGILAEDFGQKLFLFSSSSIRKQFHFSPAFVSINPVQDVYGI